MDIASKQSDAVVRPSVAHDLRWLGTIALAGAMVWATSIAAGTWQAVRAKPQERIIDVTGSAKRRIASDLVEWTALVSTHATDRTAAYKKLREDVSKAVAFLQAQGVKGDEIQPQSAAFKEVFETQYQGVGPNRIEKQISLGFETSQLIFVRSNDIAKVEKASREVTSLLEDGVTITSRDPAYFYTKLGELKVEMLAAAASDARARAENILKSAGGAKISRLDNADMGVINVNPANSSTTSWEGNNDTSTYEKDIITIIHAKFALE
jgi:uncharacterized protein